MNFAAQEKSVLCVLTLELCYDGWNKCRQQSFWKMLKDFYDDDYEKQFWSYLTTRATFHSALQKYSVSDPEKKLQKADQKAKWRNYMFSWSSKINDWVLTLAYST